ncbi:MAG TPA: 3-aminobutyryl-CoA ammonia lyase, partial [Firmicutes bacterium]|nr:3-aminobutyryl-CoA ammonia lyase [Bacillota bacterium]
MEFVLRVRMSTGDAHYGGNLVDGARIMGLFGDAATALLVYSDGDEGLFLAYEDVLFKAPVFAGDFLEVIAKIEKIGNTSRTMSFEAYKIIAANGAAGDSAADKLDPPL